MHQLIYQLIHSFNLLSNDLIFYAYIHSFIHPSVHLSVFLSIRPSTYPSIHLSMYPSVLLSIQSFIQPSNHPSTSTLIGRSNEGHSERHCCFHYSLRLFAVALTFISFQIKFTFRRYYIYCCFTGIVFLSF